ncbi:MAG: hypothetical protein JSS14_22575 [Proteobacteria bacterium]|nr:hypothetical protein [Pseudomonadota bacterium]
MKKLMSHAHSRLAMGCAFCSPAVVRGTAIALASALVTTHAFAIDANTSVNGMINLIKLGVTLVQWALVLVGMGSIGYGLMKWKKKGQENGGDQVEARQIWMPIAAGAAMICIWAVVEFVVTAAGGSSSDIGRVQGL